MDNIFAAFRKSIYNYMYVDELTPRKQQQIKKMYMSDYYDMDTLEDIVSVPLPAMNKEDKGA